MQYKCLDCGEEFNEDEIDIVVSYDKVEFWGEPCNMPYVEWFCPYCGSEDIEDTEE